MKALDMLDDSFPHGTVEGFNLGCKGGHCPAPMSCRDVRTRYHADWGFRKAVDGGMTAAELLEREQADAAAAIESDRAAREAEREAQRAEAKAAREARRSPRAPRAPRTPRPSIRPDVLRLHAEGLTDAEISRQLSVSRPWVSKIRADAGLEKVFRPGKPRPERRRDRTPEVAEMYELGMRDDAIAAELGLNINYVGTLRRSLGLPTHPLPRERKPKRPKSQRIDWRPEVARLHGEGLPDRLISEQTGISRTHVGTLRRELGLAAHLETGRFGGKPATLGHGTNGCYARGCRCEPCHEAHRAYHRAYVGKRRAAGVEAVHHGTAYGYQLGCRGRTYCPAEVTCTDAMLEQDRQRRREAGVPAAPERVPAEPVREHVRSLMDGGMSVLGIAETAGVSLSWIKTLLYGRTGPRAGEFPSHVEAEKARRLLALDRSGS